MARNGSGGYTNPSAPFQSGTVISAAAVNANFADIATALTESVAKDGQTPNIGPLRGAAGSAGAPTYTFQNDSGSGFYLQGNGLIGLAISGVNIGTFSASSFTYNGVSITGTPSGAISMYAGASAPTGWLLCFGQEISQSSFATLFAAIGTTYNTGGEGSGNFRVPDLRGRVVAGLDNMGGGAPIGRLTSPQITGGATTSGNVGGEQTHVLTVGELAAHTHIDNGHTHNIASGIVVGTGQFTGGGGVAIGAELTDSGTADLANTGTDTPHNNVQPTMVMAYIIKT